MSCAIHEAELSELVRQREELLDALQAYLDGLDGRFLRDAGKPVLLARIDQLHALARDALHSIGKPL